MYKKEIRKRRTMMYFIEAADKIVNEEGVENITIRKTANKAGYNSATLYNYFENVDHLKFFAAMRYIKDYALALPKYLEGIDNPVDVFIKVWECFCHFSYKNPKIYHAIFFADLDNTIEDYVVEYYKLFPEDLGDQKDNISTMLLKSNIYERGMATLQECVEQGYLKEKDAEDLNEMSTILHKGILSDVIQKKTNYDLAVEKTMRYIKLITNSLIIK